MRQQAHSSTNPCGEAATQGALRRVACNGQTFVHSLNLAPLRLPQPWPLEFSQFPSRLSSSTRPTRCLVPGLTMIGASHESQVSRAASEPICLMEHSALSWTASWGSRADRRAGGWVSRRHAHWAQQSRLPVDSDPPNQVVELMWRLCHQTAKDWSGHPATLPAAIAQRWTALGPILCPDRYRPPQSGESGCATRTTVRQHCCQVSLHMQPW